MVSSQERSISEFLRCDCSWHSLHLSAFWLPKFHQKYSVEHGVASGGLASYASFFFLRPLTKNTQLTTVPTKNVASSSNATVQRVPSKKTLVSTGGKRPKKSKAPSSPPSHSLEKDKKKTPKKCLETKQSFAPWPKQAFVFNLDKNVDFTTIFFM